MNSLRLRWMANGLGIEKIVLKDHHLKCYFVTNPESSYYQSDIFSAILTFVKEHPRFCTLKESNNKLMMVISNVRRVSDGLQELGKVRT